MTSVASQFHVPPFPPFPAAERYVAVGSQEETLQRVSRAIEAREAISLVIGPPGTGKSLLCQVLQARYAKSRQVVVLGDAMLQSPATLQTTLLNRLDRHRSASPASSQHTEPQLALLERIAASGPDFPGLLLLVDEAQSLSPEVLETLRILTNTMSHGRPRVSAVLLGGPALDETLALPSLESLVQRVATRCYLHPLSSDETVQYVRSVIRACGAPPEDAVEESAIRCVHRACSGIPRLINHLMSTAIDYASKKQQSRITEATIDQAWAILQQLPSPLMTEPELNKPEPAPIEFAPLSDFDNDAEFTESANGPVDESGQDALLDIDVVEQSCDNCEGCDCSEETQTETDCDSSPVEVISIEENSVVDCTQTEVDWINESYTVQSFSDGSETEGCTALSIDCQSYTSGETDDEVSPQNAASSQAEATDESLACSASTPSGEELFGTFEAEEDVDLASPAASQQAVHVANDLANEISESVSELERSLQNEILSMREASDDVEQAVVDRTPPPVLWLEDGEAAELVDDDRDMLVIEDDIVVEDAVVVNESKEAEMAPTPIAVDFQSMLAKMRNPSNA